MAIKWATTSTSRGNVLSTELNSLANNAISAVGTAVDNSSNLDTYGWFEINVTFGSAPSDTNPTLDIGMVQAPDGTNYQDSAVTGFTDQEHLFLLSIPVQKTTSAQLLVIGPFDLPPHPIKFQLDNQTGVAFPASGSTVELFTNNLASA